MLYFGFHTYLTSEAFQHALFWLSYNGQMQALLDLNSKHREVSVSFLLVIVTERVTQQIQSCAGA